VVSGLRALGCSAAGEPDRPDENLDVGDLAEMAAPHVHAAQAALRKQSLQAHPAWPSEPAACGDWRPYAPVAGADAMDWEGDVRGAVLELFGSRNGSPRPPAQGGYRGRGEQAGCIDRVESGNSKGGGAGVELNEGEDWFRQWGSDQPPRPVQWQ